MEFNIFQHGLSHMIYCLAWFSCTRTRFLLKKAKLVALLKLYATCSQILNWHPLVQTGDVSFREVQTASVVQTLRRNWSPERTESDLTKPEIPLYNLYSVHFWSPNMNSYLLFLFNWWISFNLFTSIYINFIYIFINTSI